MNQINTIEIYRYANTWAFTDAAVDLKHEPFVAGIPEIIDFAVGKSCEQATITFSKKYFPGANITLTKLKNANGGAHYKQHSADMEGWLCPALMKYFRRPPKNIYVQMEPKRS